MRTATTDGSQSNKRSLVPFRAPGARIKQQCERPKQAPQRTASFANRLAKVPQNTGQVNEGEQQHAEYGAILGLQVLRAGG